MTRVEIRPVDVDRFRELVARNVLFFNVVQSKDGETERTWQPSKDLLSSTLKSDAFRNPLPILEGVTSVPVLLPSGELQTAKGYDKRTKLILTTSEYENLPTHPPTAKEVNVAFEYLEEAMFKDFAFDSNASATNAYAA